MCSAIANYNTTEPPAEPGNIGLAISKRLTLRGFIIVDHGDRMPAMIADVSGWLSGGELTPAETIWTGSTTPPAPFIDLLRGA
jgi:NADPH-dependent curcumin reductase CurA